MKKLLYILIFIISNSLLAEFRVDHNIISYENNDSLHVYYSFSTSDVTVLKTSDSYLVDTYFNLSVKNNLNEEVIHKWNYSISFNEAPGDRINFGVKKLYLEPGQYTLQLELIDHSNKKKSSKKLKVFIKDRNKGLSVLDPVISYLVEPVNEKSNSWGEDLIISDHYVIPNPSLEFSGDSILVSYFYQVELDNYSSNELIVDELILNSKKHPVKSFRSLPVKSNNYNTVDLSELPTGVYYISFLIKSKDQRVLAKYSGKRFYIVNKNVRPKLESKFTESQEFEMSEFATMDKDMVEREYAKLKFILTNFEIDQFEQLHLLKAKQRALFKYWKLRDKDTTTVINETKMDFDKAVNYADTYFHFSAQKEGWRTDRGRILLKYGFPTDVDRFEEKEGKNACEIWYYGKLRGGVYFYFVDVNNYNNYILVHSTMINEIYDDKWIQRYNPAIDQTIYMELKNSLPDDEPDF